MPQTPKNSLCHTSKPYERPASDNKADNSAYDEQCLDYNEPQIQNSINELFVLINECAEDDGDNWMHENLSVNIANTHNVQCVTHDSNIGESEYDINGIDGMDTKLDELLDVLQDEMQQSYMTSLNTDAQWCTETQKRLVDSAVQTSPLQTGVDGALLSDKVRANAPLVTQDTKLTSMLHSTQQTLQIGNLMAQQLQLQQSLPAIIQQTLSLSGKLSDMRAQLQHIQQQYTQLTPQSADDIQDMTATIASLQTLLRNTSANTTSINDTTQSITTCIPSNIIATISEPIKPIMVHPQSLMAISTQIASANVVNAPTVNARSINPWQTESVITSVTQTQDSISVPSVSLQQTQCTSTNHIAPLLVRAVAPVIMQSSLSTPQVTCVQAHYTHATNSIPLLRVNTVTSTAMRLALQTPFTSISQTQTTSVTPTYAVAPMMNMAQMPVIHLVPTTLIPTMPISLSSQSILQTGETMRTVNKTRNMARLLPKTCAQSSVRTSSLRTLLSSTPVLAGPSKEPVSQPTLGVLQDATVQSTDHLDSPATTPSLHVSLQRYMPQEFNYVRAEFTNLECFKAQEYMQEKHNRIARVFQDTNCTNDNAIILPQQERYNARVTMLVPRSKMYFAGIESKDGYKYSTSNMHAITKNLSTYVCTHIQPCAACALMVDTKSQKMLKLHNIVDLAISKSIQSEQMCLRMLAQTMVQTNTLQQRTTIVHDRCIAFAQQHIVSQEVRKQHKANYTILMFNSCMPQDSPKLTASLEHIHDNTMRVLQSHSYRHSVSVSFAHDLAIKTLDQYEEICLIRNNGTIPPSEVQGKLRSAKTDPLYLSINRKALPTEMINIAQQAHTIRESLIQSPFGLNILFGHIANTWLYLLFEKEDICNMLFDGNMKFIVKLRNMSHVICRIHAVPEYICDPRIFVLPTGKDTVLQAFDPLVTEDRTKTRTTDAAVGDFCQILSDAWYLKTLENKLHKLNIKDYDNEIRDCCALSDSYKARFSVNGYVNSFKMIEGQFETLHTKLMVRGFQEIPCSPYVRGYGVFCYDEVCSQLLLIDSVSKVLEYTYRIVSEYLDTTRHIMLGCLNNIQRKLYMLVRFDDIDALLNSFDCAFVDRSYDFIVNMQMIRIRHLHKVVNYEMQYVNKTFIRDCRACNVLNAGHFERNTQNVECLSCLCLQEGATAIEQIIPKLSVKIKVDTILNSMELQDVNQDSFIHQFSKYICDAYCKNLSQEKNISE